VTRGYRNPNPTAYNVIRITTKI